MPTNKSTAKAPAKRAPAKKAATKAPAKATDTKSDEAKGNRRSSVVTPEVVDKIAKAVAKAPAEGISLQELVAATGLNYRQVHNATWRMEGSPADGVIKKPDERVIQRVNTGRQVRYASRLPGDPMEFRGRFATKLRVDEAKS